MAGQTGHEAGTRTPTNSNTDAKQAVWGKKIGTGATLGSNTVRVLKRENLGKTLTHPEVGRGILELLKRHRHGLNKGMSLLPEAEDGLVEQDTFVVLGVHPHQAFHEVLLLASLKRLIVVVICLSMGHSDTKQPMPTRRAPNGDVTFW